MPTDKERLDWLGSSGAIWESHGDGTWTVTGGPLGNFYGTGNSFRSAIDAAMKANAEGGGEKAKQVADDVQGLIRKIVEG